MYATTAIRLSDMLKMTDRGKLQNSASEVLVLDSNQVRAAKGTAEPLFSLVQIQLPQGNRNPNPSAGFHTRQQLRLILLVLPED